MTTTTTPNTDEAGRIAGPIFSWDAEGRLIRGSALDRPDGFKASPKPERRAG